MAEQPKGKMTATLSVRDLPEVLFELRRELAQLLRREAGAESNPEVARRFREVADQFEPGVAFADARTLRQKQKRKR